MRQRSVVGGLTIVAGVAAVLVSHALARLNQRGFSGSTDDPAIAYATRPATDAVSELATRLEAGTVTSAFEPLP